MVLQYYIIIILWDHRRTCGPSLTETSSCGANLYTALGLNLRTNYSGNKVKSHYETGKGGLGYRGTVLTRIEFKLSTVRAVGTSNISGRSVAPFQTR